MGSLNKFKIIDNKLNVGCQKCGKAKYKMIVKLTNNGADENTILCFNCWLDFCKNEK